MLSAVVTSSVLIRQTVDPVRTTVPPPWIHLRTAKPTSGAGAPPGRTKRARISQSSDGESAADAGGGSCAAAATDGSACGTTRRSAHDPSSANTHDVETPAR